MRASKRGGILYVINLFTSTWNICSAYAPQVSLGEEEKKKCWGVLDEVVRGVPSLEKIFIGGDFNGHIGSLPIGYADVHGGFGFGVRNDKGAALLDFAKAFGLVVVNSSFSKKKKHLVTFRSRVGRFRRDWWWNEEVKKKKVESKKTAYAKLVESKDEGEKQGLEERGGEKKLFRLAKAWEWKGRDLNQVKCIKGDDGRVLVEDALIKKR
ncbi:uncharacterized protein LOC107861897 [Capsicum annuum]|uniref:uncharacterized protein LOC107861897 n=1 Tax=Capsicum annuum TaxID=4072 RepID=UPI0007BF8964|nr:uncharacterized protein LOC107861897 [Capsicum annuum]